MYLKVESIHIQMDDIVALLLSVIKIKIIKINLDYLEQGNMRVLVKEKQQSVRS